MNNKHQKNKKTLKIIGFLTLIPGIILTILGFVSFFIAFGSNEMPTFFFLSFIGLPLCGVGSTCLTFGYRKEVTTYIKNEGVPVVKELYNDVKPEFEDMVNTFKGKKTDEIICPKCGNSNEPTSKFCNECGTPLTRTCPICNSIISNDSKFCPNCGSKLD